MSDKVQSLVISEIDDFVAFVDEKCGGNLRHPEVLKKYIPFSLKYTTEIPKTIDPFSEQYFESQIRLYEEISGRKLDQWSGELHPASISDLIDAPNPQGIIDTSYVAENVRTVTTMLSLACLQGSASILDMGAGHGMSSEVFAFCGADVTAVDIDPLLSDLSQLRSGNRKLKITRAFMNFDSISALPKKHYQAAIFFQSLHHALRPLALIKQLREHLTEDGVILFAGEPILTDWFPQWGIRLDEESVYVARKFGWFETGWSHDFIQECFTRNQMNFTFFTGGHLGGWIGAAALKSEKMEEIRGKAMRLGLVLYNKYAAAKYHSQIGDKINNSHQRVHLKSRTKLDTGYLCYGPYISLPRGKYRVSFTLVNCDGSPNLVRTPNSSVIFDVVSDSGKAQHLRQEIQLRQPYSRDLFEYNFRLETDCALVEARLLVQTAGERWEMSLPEFESADGCS